MDLYFHGNVYVCVSQCMCMLMYLCMPKALSQRSAMYSSLPRVALESWSRGSCASCHVARESFSLRNYIWPATISSKDYRQSSTLVSSLAPHIVRHF